MSTTRPLGLLMADQIWQMTKPARRSTDVTDGEQAEALEAATPVAEQPHTLLEAERAVVRTWRTGELWHAAINDAGLRQLYHFPLTDYQRAVLDELRERGEAIDAVLGTEDRP